MDGTINSHLSLTATGPLPRKSGIGTYRLDGSGRVTVGKSPSSTLRPSLGLTGAITRSTDFMSDSDELNSSGHMTRSSRIPPSPPASITSPLLSAPASPRGVTVAVPGSPRSPTAGLHSMRMLDAQAVSAAAVVSAQAAAAVAAARAVAAKAAAAEAKAITAQKAASPRSTSPLNSRSFPQPTDPSTNYPAASTLEAAAAILSSPKPSSSATSSRSESPSRHYLGPKVAAIVRDYSEKAQQHHGLNPIVGRAVPAPDAAVGASPPRQVRGGASGNSSSSKVGDGNHPSQSSGHTAVNIAGMAAAVRLEPEDAMHQVVQSKLRQINVSRSKPRQGASLGNNNGGSNNSSGPSSPTSTAAAAAAAKGGSPRAGSVFSVRKALGGKNSSVSTSSTSKSKQTSPKRVDSQPMSPTDSRTPKSPKAAGGFLSFMQNTLQSLHVAATSSPRAPASVGSIKSQERLRSKALGSGADASGGEANSSSGSVGPTALFTKRSRTGSSPAVSPRAGAAGSGAGSSTAFLEDIPSEPSTPGAQPSLSIKLNSRTSRTLGSSGEWGAGNTAAAAGVPRAAAGSAAGSCGGASRDGADGQQTTPPVVLGQVWLNASVITPNSSQSEGGSGTPQRKSHSTNPQPISPKQWALPPPPLMQNGPARRLSLGPLFAGSPKGNQSGGGASKLNSWGRAPSPFIGKRDRYLHKAAASSAPSNHQQQELRRGPQPLPPPVRLSQTRREQTGSGDPDFPGFHTPTKMCAEVDREIVWSGKHSDPVAKGKPPETAVAAALASAVAPGQRGVAGTAQVTAVVSQKGGGRFLGKKRKKPAEGSEAGQPQGVTSGPKGVCRCRWWMSVIVLGLLLLAGGFTVGMLLPKLLNKDAAATGPTVNSLWYSGGAKAGPAAGAVSWGCQDVLGTDQVRSDELRIRYTFGSRVAGFVTT